MVSSIDKQLVRKHFDRHAREYDEYAAIQFQMAERLAACVRESLQQAPKAVLEIGCGTGGFTERILHDHSDARLTAIDISPRMIELARERCGHHERVHFISADIEQVSIEGSLDLIASNAAFQWLNNPAQTVKTLSESLCAGGLLAFSTFGPDTFQELHRAVDVAKSSLGVADARRVGQSFASLAEWVEQLAAADLVVRLAEEERTQLFYKDAREFLHAVQRTGASNSNSYGSPLGRRLLTEIYRQYEGRFSTNKGVPATYHVMYFVVEGPQRGGAR